MTRTLKWGLIAAVVGVIAVLIVVVSVDRYQGRVERETHAPERLEQRLGRVQAGQESLQLADLDLYSLRRQEQARIVRLLTQDLAQANPSDPGMALALLTPAAVAPVASEEGLVTALTRRLRALPKNDWQRQVVAPDHWQLVAGDDCLVLRNLSESAVQWRWTSISRCDID